eukprot:5515356-Amphidinium_carterae.1
MASYATTGKELRVELGSALWTRKVSSKLSTDVTSQCFMLFIIISPESRKEVVADMGLKFS